LIKHYTMKHPAISDNLPLLPNCYKVTFVEQPPCENLDWCEDKWMQRTKASINRQNDLTRYQLLSFFLIWFCFYILSTRFA